MNDNMLVDGRQHTAQPQTLIQDNISKINKREDPPVVDQKQWFSRYRNPSTTTGTIFRMLLFSLRSAICIFFYPSMVP